MSGGEKLRTKFPYLSAIYHFSITHFPRGVTDLRCIGSPEAAAAMTHRPSRRKIDGYGNAKLPITVNLSV